MVENPLAARSRIKEGLDLGGKSNDQEAQENQTDYGSDNQDNCFKLFFFIWDSFRLIFFMMIWASCSGVRERLC